MTQRKTLRFPTIFLAHVAREFAPRSRSSSQRAAPPVAAAVKRGVFPSASTTSGSAPASSNMSAIVLTERSTDSLRCCCWCRRSSSGCSFDAEVLSCSCSCWWGGGAAPLLVVRAVAIGAVASAPDEAVGPAGDGDKLDSCETANDAVKDFCDSPTPPPSLSATFAPGPSPPPLRALYSARQWRGVNPADVAARASACESETVTF